MPDTLTPEQRRKNMQAIRSTNTKMEVRVARELWRRGLRFRRNTKDLFGKPDISVKKYRAVVFLDSCFWHGCPEHCRIPGSNRDFWTAKLERNIRRDLAVTNHYRQTGWHILRIWEHEVKADFDGTIEAIRQFLLRAADAHQPPSVH